MSLQNQAPVVETGSLGTEAAEFDAMAQNTADNHTAVASTSGQVTTAVWGGNGRSHMISLSLSYAGSCNFKPNPNN